MLLQCEYTSYPNFSPYSAETVTMQILFADHDQDHFQSYAIYLKKKL